MVGKSGNDMKIDHFYHKEECYELTRPRILTSMEL